MGVSVIIPTLNAGAALDRLLAALENQTIAPDEIIVVDSQSEDDTVRIAKGYDRVRVIEIARGEFDHGGTRDMALRQTKGEFVLFLTQDALPADERAIERLLKPFEDPRVAAAGGRQIAWPNARPAEKLMRAHSYPEKSRVWQAEDIKRLGLRAFLISDVFAAYRKEAYLAAGGFDHPLLTDEDVLMAQRLLRTGYKLAYSGEAAVFHSHDFTFAQQFRRNLLIGRVLRRYEERLEGAREMGEGVRLARAIVAQLVREGHFIECARFSLDCAARLLGNRMGRWIEGRSARGDGV